jgi:hypothetical protein
MRQLIIIALVSGATSLSAASPDIRVMRVPNGGIQPQTVTADGVVHLLYFKGEVKAGNLYYCTLPADSESWSSPIRVNSQLNSAVAMGNMRGGRLAAGKNGHVHVAWNGSSAAQPRTKHPPDRHHADGPMLYSRLIPGQKRFEPQRNLMTTTFGLDGGGSVAADSAGSVYVVWHATVDGAAKGEGGRSVWMARSTDDGKTFPAEVEIATEPLGACGCCGLHAVADDPGLRVLYRTARNNVNRDMALLSSGDGGKTFATRIVDRWKIGRCVISTSAFTVRDRVVLGAWETRGQIVWQDLARTKSGIRTVPGRGHGRKYPSLARNSDAYTLVTWTEGGGWNKAGRAHWQLFNSSGNPIPEKSGSRKDSPVWNFPAAATTAAGEFLFIY